MNKEDLKKRLEEIKQKIPAEHISYPSPSQIIKNATTSIGQNIKEMISGNSIMVEEAVSSSRLEICKKCDFFDNANNRCKKCGCYMEIKTKLRIEKCPVNKW
jgi:hypothetical protein